VQVVLKRSTRTSRHRRFRCDTFDRIRVGPTRLHWASSEGRTPCSAASAHRVRRRTRLRLTVDISEHLRDSMRGLRGGTAADALCEACVQLLDVDAAAISLVFEGVPSGTLGASGDHARIYDELQFTMGEGPCLDSVALGAPVLVSNLADLNDLRWPAYRPALLEQEIRAVFAIPILLVGDYLGALDLFRGLPGQLTDAHLAAAFLAGALAAMPVLDLLDADLQAAITDPRSDAWSDLSALYRADVSQATGMLVAQLEVEPAEALVRLRAYAYVASRSITEVARDILERRLKLDADPSGPEGGSRGPSGD
jgi:hypothetical protein